MRRQERLFVAAGVLGLLALWEAMVRLGRLDATLAPAPTTILAGLIRLGRRPGGGTSLGGGVAPRGRVDAPLPPAPTTILEALIRLGRRPEVVTSLGVTAGEVIAAFLVAVPVGLFIGFPLAEVPFLGALL